jgi:hypothetical protein
MKISFILLNLGALTAIYAIYNCFFIPIKELFRGLGFGIGAFLIYIGIYRIKNISNDRVSSFTK